MKHLNLFAAALTLTLVASSCKKDDVIEQEQPKITRGLFVLSEGNFGRGNTTLSFYNATNNTTTTDYFATANGKTLGETGNDLLLYGGKIYIVMNGESTIEVVDPANGKSIKQIKLTGMPRYAVAYKNKILVSAYDNTVSVIDTTSLTSEKSITVGAQPEGLAVSGDQLFVANSGGFNPVFDSTLSVINLTTMTETKKIKVGLNPGSVVADNSGNIYVACTGNYASVKPSLVKVNAAAGTITKSADTAVGKMKFYNGQLYATGGYSGSKNVRVLNTTDFAQASPNFVTDGTVITLPYGLNIDESTGDVYITDGKDYTAAGEVFAFDKTGKKKFSFSVSPGVNPNSVGIWKQ